MRIKAKLILLFIIIKVIPLVLILFMSLVGIEKLSEIIAKKAQITLSNSIEIIQDTTNLAIEDSIYALDKKSQESLEIMTKTIASNVASFLYQRDNDVLYLSHIEKISHKIIKDFYDANTRKVIIPQKFVYDVKNDKWIIEHKKDKIVSKMHANLKENAKYFSHKKDKKYDTKSLPTYKEITYIDLLGHEKVKVSSINKKLLDVSKKENTYCHAETYFQEIQHLKMGEIYVSDVIGEYIKSNIIGSYTKKKTEKFNLKFDPKMQGYAGKENPEGKRFDGIVRFVTPRYKNGKKIGYVSLALDHRHIMEFTDYVVPTKERIRNYSNASTGNYAFMWDEKGRNISHPRDYFISGFDKETGKRVKPWLSQDISDKIENSTEDWEEFLKSYPSFENQSLSKKPTLAQLKEGNIPLDCRYLNFAPQCDGWMQITEDGGYGSFVIFWSNVWKLTTVATIPYYTGKYQYNKRGFGFVTMGANLSQFHGATTKIKESIKKQIDAKLELINSESEQNDLEISKYVESLIHELTISTIIMIFIVVIIAILIANYITSSIKKLIIGTRKFQDNDFDYRIDIKSNDEIGLLSSSFNNMAESVKSLFEIKEKLTIELTQSNEELKKSELKLLELNNTLEKEITKEIKNSRAKDLQLLNQSKMASLGDMIGNIAHQWRQPLSIISTTASGMKLEKEYNILEDDKFNSYCDLMISKTKYLSETIDTFRNFVKDDKETKSTVLQDTIEDSCNIINTSLQNNHIELIKDIYRIEPIEMEMVSGEINQVIINIINNSKDVLIEKKIDKPFVEIILEESKDTVIITIEDNGGGIKRDIIPKIFEPYFTTKHQSQGTGLGLHMSYKIITESLKGKIYVENTNLGAKFFIEIPKNETTKEKNEF